MNGQKVAKEVRITLPTAGPRIRSVHSPFHFFLRLRVTSLPLAFPAAVNVSFPSPLCFLPSLFRLSFLIAFLSASRRSLALALGSGKGERREKELRRNEKEKEEKCIR